MLLRGAEGNELQLEIAGYRFPEEERDPWDSNGLLVSVRVLSPEGSWSVLDPCLTTWEAKRLVSWLVHAATREPWAAAMTFAEPNLTMLAGPVAGDPNRVQVRASFALELRPPWAHTLVGSDNLTVDLDVRRGDLALAAASLLSDLAEFPQRGDDPTL
jgi:hypothetical protein